MNSIQIVLAKDIIPADTELAIAKANDKKKEIAQLANQFSGLTAFEDHQAGCSENTNKAQHGDLSLFGNFINSIYDSADNTELALDKDDRLSAGQLFRDPAIWQVVTHGLVKLFRKHMLEQGFSISSVNRALSSIRRYASLASEAGQLPFQEMFLIKQVAGYSQAKGKNIDEDRPKSRRGNKKEESIPIPHEVIDVLLSEDTYPDTSVGKRDRLIIAILLDWGLRASEISALKPDKVDMQAGLISVYRKKTKSTDKLTMTPAIQQALKDYLTQDTPPPHPDGSFLIRAGYRTGILRDVGMTPSAVSKVMTKYGKLMAIQFNMPQLAKLSSHDGRHQWTTDAFNAGINIDRIRQAGGWSSSAMPIRYANNREIANDGALLDRAHLKIQNNL